MKSTRKEVYKAIDSERDYQDSRWNRNTTNSEGIHSEYEWLIFIQDYVNEGMHIASREPEPDARKKVNDQLRKIAAMAINALEQNGVSPRIIT